MSKPSPALLTKPAAPRERLPSLDQFRGYTVVGMLLVNFVGSFAACPQVLKHSHDYLSYADTIMPQFLFAVGFAFRLTFGRRAELQSNSRAYARMVRRLLGLVLISLLIYQVGPRAASWQELSGQSLWETFRDPLKRDWFQTLMHIAVTSLWILPVIRANASIRILWMVASAIAHVLLSYWFNFEWVNSPPNGIDGGPLGFLTWTIPAIVGTLACDALATAGGRSVTTQLISWSLFLMALGYLFSCGTRLYDVSPSQVEQWRHQKLAEDPVFLPREVVTQRIESAGLASLTAEPPFFSPPNRDHRKWNYWMMSQRAATLSYLTFAAGFSLAVFTLFHIACDHYGWQLGFFRTFGTNAIAAYVLHDLVGEALKPFIPGDSPGWYVAAAVLVFFAINWLVIRHFEKQGIYLRV